MRIAYGLCLGLTMGVLFSASEVCAGVPECGDIRLEDVQSCELRASGSCSASCSELGVYKTACATKLYTSCRSECTLSADVTCTDECTESCTAQCDAGVNITCTHNCFAECEGACEFQCQGSDDPERCRATCEATCDGECDVKCAPLVNGSCYQHCIECCGGSCGAQANMHCQEVCQNREFEVCEHEFRADCDASCDVQGAIFCDGKYVISGDELPACVEALLAKGFGDLEGTAKGTLDIGADGIDFKGAGKGKGGLCAVSFGTTRSTRTSPWGIAAVALLLWRRRRGGPADTSHR